jgi:DNA-binding transcriptional MocR family regulator
MCHRLFASGAAAAIRSRVQAEFADRLQGMINRLGAFDLAWQPGVPFVWLRMPMGWRASAFTRMAEVEGVLVRPADEYALIGGRAPNAVRLAIAGNLPRADFDAALDCLARLLRNPPSDLAA